MRRKDRKRALEIFEWIEDMQGVANVDGLVISWVADDLTWEVRWMIKGRVFVGTDKSLETALEWAWEQAYLFFEEGREGATSLT